MDNVIPTAANPVQTRDLKPMVLGEGNGRVWGRQTLPGPEGPDRRAISAREVVLDTAAVDTHEESASSDEHSLI